MTHLTQTGPIYLAVAVKVKIACKSDYSEICWYYTLGFPSSSCGIVR
jgi:hypothetical protein